MTVHRTTSWRAPRRRPCRTAEDVAGRISDKARTVVIDTEDLLTLGDEHFAGIAHREVTVHIEHRSLCWCT